jgi:hypothetical protein
MEILVGTTEKDEISMRDFLETQFEIASLDVKVAEEAIRLRRAHHMRLPDAIIWATARVNGVELVSRNTKDFHANWDGIRVPYELKPEAK